MTVVVMVPVKALLAAASPLPPNLLASEAVASSPLRPPSGSLASAVMEAARLALRSALADDFLLAAVCSTRLTVIVADEAGAPVFEQGPGEAGLVDRARAGGLGGAGVGAHAHGLVHRGRRGGLQRPRSR
jgi:hypothetical protein